MRGSLGSRNEMNSHLIRRGSLVIKLRVVIFCYGPDETCYCASTAGDAALGGPPPAFGGGGTPADLL